MLKGKLLWEPSQQTINQSNIKKFMMWLEENRGLKFEDYNQLWDWSVTEIENFWTAIWEFFNIKSETDYTSVLSGNKMPNVKWFEGATLNYAEHVFRNEDPEKAAVIHQSEIRPVQEVTWAELRKKTAAIATYLKSLGVKSGDRVVGYAPNIPETLTSFLACASIGAVWSSCAPEFGIQSVIDRFKQIEPTVMIAVDGYQYGGKRYDRLELVKKIQADLPSLKKTILVPYLETQPEISELNNTVLWEQVISDNDDAILTFEPVPFNHPLWILYSSGTTGKPKGIVQGQGGILLEHLKFLGLQVDLKKGDRFFWYTTTGWMMWNVTVSGLLTGAAIVLYDGNPSYPNDETLWSLAESTKMTTFGTSASFLMASLKAGIKPKEQFDLSHLRSIGSTGSPLPESGFDWVYEYVKEDIWLTSTSGGTDICSGFVGGSPTLPVYSGEIQARVLGSAVKAFNDAGEGVINEIGELVVTEPMPSMPIYFWNDKNGVRYKESYFDVYPDIWRHGDFIEITDRGSAIIYGRSDATINRGGIRMGTSEIYSALESIPEVIDSLIVDIPISAEQSYMPLFIVLKEGFSITDELKTRINQSIRQNCSPRHVPNEIFPVNELPKTLNGKKIEVPIKKILMGVPIEQAVNLGSLNNPETLDYFVEFKRLLESR
ncbi:acetoacetate--CoA ligase [Neobacillus rhizophilus]|uniref:Acetoacetate--CoA ligase n=1 Tax=Neobacillus rhizophilus TaxID=2833579 RepID=A0A942U9G5_9BACI|nr:acetoacetate--CoA ligase [Neobacillus rhizophilus]MBS4215033.1 acetoacetate--CoA ligase [Neobacillus rhizophilus]MBU8919189.1 acetoacetate--CoA ligase [Bacillus sp. FJAT-29953]